MCGCVTNRYDSFLSPWSLRSLQSHDSDHSPASNRDQPNHPPPHIRPSLPSFPLLPSIQPLRLGPRQLPRLCGARPSFHPVGTDCECGGQLRGHRSGPTRAWEEGASFPRGFPQSKSYGGEAKLEKGWQGPALRWSKVKQHVPIKVCLSFFSFSLSPFHDRSCP